MGKASELGDNAGWTVEEYLNWMKQHPKVKAEFGLSKEAILEYCLMGSITSYLDKEQGAAFFDGNEFKELLAAVGDLDVDENTYYDNWSEMLAQGASVLEQYYIGDFVTVTTLTELMYQDELIFKGYPGPDGAPRYFLSANCLSILSRSNCKEGAYAFIEFYLTHDSGSDTCYFTKKDSYAASVQKALETESLSWYGTDERLPMMSEELWEKQEKLYQYAVKGSLFLKTIRKIVIEEA